MRRILAITLLIAFGSPLFIPLFAATADPDASLPACCRRHGAHRCGMTMSLSGAPSGPAFQALPCPSYPIASTPLRTAAASLAPPLQTSAGHLRNRAALGLSFRFARTSFPSANPKRGPPTLLAS